MLADHLGIAAFNMMTLHEVNELTIFKQCDRRRRRWVGERKFPCLSYCFFVNASKNRRQLARLFVRVLKSPFYPWAGCTCSTSTNGINHQECRSFLIIEIVFHFFWSLKFSETHAG